MTREEFRKWFLSLTGHIIFYGGLFFVAFASLFLAMGYQQGNLTYAMAARVIVVCATVSTGAAAVIWYGLTAALIKSGAETKNK